MPPTRPKRRPRTPPAATRPEMAGQPASDTFMDMAGKGPLGPGDRLGTHGRSPSSRPCFGRRPFGIGAFTTSARSNSCTGTPFASWPNPNTRVTSRKLAGLVKHAVRTTRAAGLSCGGSGARAQVAVSLGRGGLCRFRVRCPAAARCRAASAYPTGSAHTDLHGHR
jgi:hypothetical protein